MTNSCIARLEAKVIFSALLFGLVALSACAGDEDNAGGGASGTGTGGQAGQSGTAGTVGTAGTGDAALCGAAPCQAGQHCFNGICINGCLTDANCAANQSCQDINSDTSIGTCRNNPMAAVKDCAAFCDKAIACQDPMAALCMDQCTGSSAECVECVVASNCGEGCEAACEL